MTRDECFDAMVGLMAYDRGCVSSGIHDPLLKEKCREFLENEAALKENEHRLYPKFLDERVAEEFLSYRARKQGYGLEDVREFLEWMANEMGWE